MKNCYEKRKIAEKQAKKSEKRFKKIHKKHDEELAKEKCDGYFIFPEYSDSIDEIKQKGIANTFTLRCVESGLSMDKKVQVTFDDGTLISEDALIVKNNNLKNRFEFSILTYIKFMKINMCYYYCKKDKSYYRVVDGCIIKPKLFHKIYLDVTNRQFCYNTPYFALGHACSVVEGLNTVVNYIHSKDL